MKRVVADAETNGLIPHPTLKGKSEVTMVHCINLRDADTREVILRTRSDSREFPLQLAYDYMVAMEEDDVLIGHNLMGYDLEVFNLIAGITVRCKVIDTMVLSRLVYPDLWEQDSILKAKGLIPGGLMNKHTLEAWGYRLKMHKGDYSAEMKAKGLDPWAEVNDDMCEYCEGDTALTAELFYRLMLKKPSPQSVELEHQVWAICLHQMRVGVGFDESGAAMLYAELSARRNGLEADLKKTFGSWEVRLADFIPKKPNKTKGYLVGVPVERWKTIEFSPSSRDHIALVLKKKYGWTPGTFTDTGKAEVSEDVLKVLPFPEAKQLLEFLMLDKRVGQLSNGAQGWLRHSINNRIYGYINTNGAATGRATHSRPNLGQVPKCGSPYGKECRALYQPRAGWGFVGADASGLELRCLAHYLSFYDQGAYARIVTTGDVHTTNQLAAGLPTRNDAKTFIYALLYGAGDALIGAIVGKGAASGRKLRSKFMANIPAYAKLVALVQSKAKGAGILKGLDGRNIICRSPHSALNFLLQGAGAVIMKQAMANYVAILAAKGIVLGRDYNQVLWVHDEFQVECRMELREIIGQAMVEGIRKVTQDFNLNCPLDGEFKIGSNWSETH